MAADGRNATHDRLEAEAAAHVGAGDAQCAPRLRLARAFADLVRHRRGYLLLEWIRQAEPDAHKLLKGIAGLLRQDLDAVTAGLTLPWSSGVVEGHVNRVKTLKRAMNGRASFELLRTRILENGP
ncbi:transposase [Streptomyces sp. NPDC018957]|uniref:transposase n=1 Tax=Streptomyces sp. NPDC018957 TaxID=3365056 RepID=UPI0037987562